MKLRHLLLFALVLLIPAGLTYANPVDPSVIINRAGGDLVKFSMNSMADPLVIDLNNHGLTTSPDFFQYTGTATLTELFVVLDEVIPGETFSCKSNIFTGDCESFIPMPGVGTDGDHDELGFEFTLGPGGIGLMQNDVFSVQVATPEPGTIILLLTGAIPLIDPFARRAQRKGKNPKIAAAEAVE